jgi:hypothetical protein
VIKNAFNMKADASFFSMTNAKGIILADRHEKVRTLTFGFYFERFSF